MRTTPIALALALLLASSAGAAELHCPKGQGASLATIGYGLADNSELDALDSQGVPTRTVFGCCGRIDILPDGRVFYVGDTGSGQGELPEEPGFLDAALADTATVLLDSEGTLHVYGADTSPLHPAPDDGPFVEVSCGAAHCAARRADGTVAAWGDTKDGKTTPPDPLTGVVAIAAGTNHTLALINDGTVVAWGLDSSGQITVPAGATDVRAIAAGANHSVAVTNQGKLVAWGLKTGGVTTAPEADNVVDVACGDDFSVARQSDGGFLVWGSGPVVDQMVGGLEGQLVTIIAAGGTVATLTAGTCNTIDPCDASGEVCGGAPCGGNGISFTCQCEGGEPSSPVLVTHGVELDDSEIVITGGSIIAIDFSDIHAGALYSDGSVITTLGVAPQADPTYVDIAVASEFAVLLRADGSVVGFGAEDLAAIPPKLPALARIEAGNKHIIGLTRTGTVALWSGTTLLPVPTGLVDVVEIAAGKGYAAALTAAGTVVVWGEEADGIAASVSGTTDARKLGGGWTHVMVTHGSGGLSMHFQSGDGGGQEVPADLGPVKALVGGVDISGAIGTDGSVTLWGPSAPLKLELGPVTDLALGNGTVLGIGAPSCEAGPECSETKPCPGDQVCTAQPEGGATCACAPGYEWDGTACVDIDECADLGDCPKGQQCVNTLGSWYCTCATPGLEPAPPFITAGRQSEGPPNTVTRRDFTQLSGGGVAGAGTAPGAVEDWRLFQSPPFSGLVHVAVTSTGVALGVRANGDLEMWGDPYAIGTFFAGAPAGSFLRVYGGLGNHAAAIRTDDTLVTWGADYPTVIPGPISVPEVFDAALGQTHGVAIKIDGSLYSWGDNTHGQSTPPPGIGPVQRVAVGYTQTYAQLTTGKVTAWGDLAPDQLAWIAGLSQIVDIAAHGHAFAARDIAGNVHTLVIDAGDGDQPNRVRSLPIDAYRLLGNEHSVTAAVNIGCIDIDECYEGTAVCGANSHCVNTVGSYTCECDAGYEPGPGGCVDIDECAEELHGCDPPATCVNTAGGYECGCDAGYVFAQDVATFGTALPAVQLPAASALSGYGDHFAAIVEGGRVQVYDTQGPVTLPGLDAVTGAVSVAVGTGFVAVAHGGGVQVFGDQALAVANVPAGLSGISAVAAGSDHVVALRADGTVIAWGNNAFGQATAPAGLTNVMQVEAGDGWSAALTTTGNVVVWGALQTDLCNDCLRDIVQMSAGVDHLLLRRDDGTVRCQGSNAHGQCAVPIGLQNIASVAAGDGHSLALDHNGAITAWGRSDQGQLVVPALDATRIAAFGTTSLALVAFGCVDANECLDPATVCPSYASCVNTVGSYSCDCDPGFVLDPTTGNCVDEDECVTGNHACDPTSQLCVNVVGGVECHCQTGFQTVTPITPLTPYTASVPGPAPNFYQDVLHADVDRQDGPRVAGGIAALADGTVRVWGGYLNVPEIVAGVAAETDVVQVAAIMAGAAVLRSDGTIEHWIDPVNGYYTQFGAVPATASPFVQLSGAGSNFCAVRADGTVAVWGHANYPGSQGYNGVRIVPPTATNVVKVVCNPTSAMALRADGSVVTWGTEPMNASNPLWPAPASLGPVSDIAMSVFFNAGLKADGSVQTWGSSPVTAGTTGNQAMIATDLMVWTVDADGQIAATPDPTTLWATGDPRYSAVSPLPDWPIRDLNAGWGWSAIALSDMCIDTDECTTTPNICGPGSTCVNTPGSYNCICAPGYVLNPATGQCEDEDECQTGTHPCDLTTQACVNTIGGVQCDCLPAYDTINPIHALTMGLGTPPSVSLDVTSAHVAGGAAAVALTDGSVRLWGPNVPSALVSSVAAAADAVEVAVVDDHSGNTAVAIRRADGTLQQWTNTNPLFQPLPPSGSPFVQLTGSARNFCGVRADGTVAVWGRNTSVLPNPGYYPIQAGAAAITNAAQISCGTTWAAVLHNDGTVTLWGVLLPSFNNPVVLPLPPAPFGSPTNPFVKVIAGPSNALFERADGSVVSWGASQHPVTVTSPLAMDVGQQTSWFIDQNGSVSWASDVSQANIFYSGNGLLPFPTVPVHTVQSGFSDWTIAIGDMCNPIDCGPGYELNLQTGTCDDIDECQTGDHACDLSSQVCVNVPGGVECDCIGGFTQVNPLHAINGAVGPLPTPQLDVISASVANGLGIAALADGSVVTWGTSVPTAVATGTAAIDDAWQVAASDVGAAVLRADGTIESWVVAIQNPLPTPNTLSPFIQLDSTGLDFCAVRADGSIAVWGISHMSMHGNTAMANPPALTNAVKVSCSEYYGVALLDDGTLTAWGTTVIAPPAGLTNVVDVSIGPNHGAATLADGSVVTWGPDGMPIPQTNPLAVESAWGVTFVVDNSGQVSVESNYASSPFLSPTFPTVPVHDVQSDSLLRAIGISAMCVDIDECSDPSVICPTGSVCVNQPGGYSCDCGPGYTYNPATGQCEDNDECATGNHPCDLTTQVCVNIPGGVECECQTGYTQINPLIDITSFYGGIPTFELDIRWVDVAFRLGAVVLADQSVELFGQLAHPNLTAGVATIHDADQVAVITESYGSRSAAAVLHDDGTISQWASHPSLYDPPPNTSSPFVQLASDTDFKFCAVRADGTVAVWGRSVAPGGYGWAITQVPASVTNAVKVQCSASYAIALLDDGTLVAWGDAPVSYPPATLAGVVDIATGRTHALAELSDGSVVTWGQNAAPVTITDPLWIDAAQSISWMVGSDGSLQTSSVTPLPSPWIPINTPQHPLNMIATSSASSVLGASDMCVDINECDDLPDPCPTGATCVNTPGGYTCECAPGFTYNPVTGQCEDEDECATGNHPCDLTTQICVNTAGGVECDCQAGFNQVNPIFDVTPFHGGLPTFELDVRSHDVAFRLGAVALADGSASAFGQHATSAITTGLSTIADAVEVATNAQSWGNRGAVVVRHADGTLSQFASDAAYGSAPSGTFTQIASGGSLNFCGVRTDGTVAAWGVSSQGGFGQAMVQVPANVTNIVKVDCMDDYAIAVTASGTLISWGGQVVTPPAGLTNVVDIAVGPSHAAAKLGDGSVVTWGTSAPTTTPADPKSFSAAADILWAVDVDGAVDPHALFNPYSLPYLPVSLPPYPVNAIATSPANAVLTASDLCVDTDECTNGTAVCATNEVCVNTPGGYSCECAPGYVLDPLTGECEDENECEWPAPPCGPNAVCTNTPGSYLCTCDPGYAQTTVGPWVINATGLSDYEPAAMPTTVAAVSAGGRYGLALLTDGTAVPFGEQIPAGTPPSIANVAQVLADTSTAVVRLTNGDVLSWGTANYPPITGAAYIAAHSGAMAVIDTQGGVTVYGNNAFGQANVPASAQGAVSVSSGGNHILALMPNGTVVAWGGNSHGQTDVPSGLTGVIDIAAGASTSLAVLSDHSVVAWGAEPDNLFNWFTDLKNGVVALEKHDEAVLAWLTDGSLASWRPNGGTGISTLHPEAVDGAISPDGPVLLGPVVCVDINECTDPTVLCGANATCTNLPGTVACECNPGYSGDGQTCVLDDPCDPDPCQNDGVCTPAAGGNFACACEPGWAGAVCDQPVYEACSNGADDDGDGLTDCDDPDCAQSLACTTLDPDKDGITTAVEQLCGTDPYDAAERPTDDEAADPDGDGEPSCVDEDDDGDGLPDTLEEETETDPTDPDTDNDGVEDGLEDANANGQVDPGETDPREADTDNDGLDDGVEFTSCYGVEAKTKGQCARTDGANADTDADGLPDGAEDANGNGKVDPGETNPTLADTDGDGFDDPDELTCLTDPTSAKSTPEDGDDTGVCDGAETDSDKDGWSDGIEALCQTDPNNPKDAPRKDALGDYDGDGIPNCRETDQSGNTEAPPACTATDTPTSSSWPLLPLLLALLTLLQRRRQYR